MDSLLAVKGRDFVIVAADASSARSVLRMKSNEDKIVVLDERKLLASAGPVGDRGQFSEYMQKNLKLYRYRNNLPLSMHATANFMRGELADALRRAPYQVNLLLAGYDAEQGPSLYFMDYLASMHKLDFAAHGYCAYFALSLMDRLYKKDMDLDEALYVIKACINELKMRFIINSPKFVIKLVGKDGVQVLEQAEEEVTETDKKGKGKMEE